jgi:small conductance mechanosensitive channel
VVFADLNQDLEDWHLKPVIAVIVIILVAIVASWLVKRVIRHSVAGMRSLRSSIGPVDQRARRRSSTVTAVLNSTAIAVIWTIAIITILSQLGVNVSALVAGASIVGAALAFGAQQVVRDLLAGFFMFTEDQYGVGDTVDLGLATGTVEAVTLRVTRLRDIEGKVWYVPHGQIQRVANLTQEWAQVVLDVPVDRSSDVTEAARQIEAAAASVRDDAAYAGDVLADPRVLGVQDIQDDRIVLRLVMRTSPARQFDLTRAVRARILHAMGAGQLKPPSVQPGADF